MEVCKRNWTIQGYNHSMLDIYDIALLIPLSLLMMYWWRTSEQKQVAVAGARAYCKERNLQLLDETLVFKSHRLEKVSVLSALKALPGPVTGSTRTRPRRRLCRVYEFDYSEAGEDRHNGEIVLSGYRILRVILHSDVLEITNYH